MALADGSQTRYYFAEETTWASPPSGTYEEIRFTSESLSESKDSVVSDEIRSDRQTTDVQQTQISADGDLNFELTFTTFDSFFEGVLLNTWNSPLSLSLTGVDVTNQDTIEAALGDFDAVEEGQWIQTSGFDSADNNGIFRVQSIAGDGSSVTVQYATLVNETSQDVSIDGETITNGTTRKSYTLEKELSDVGEYLRYPGLYFSEMSLSLSAGDLLTGTFSTMAQQEEVQSSMTPSSITDANTNPITNATTHINEVRENGSTDLTVSSFDLDYSNGLRERPAVGSETTQEFGLGKIDVSGSLEVYFENADLYQRYLDFTDSDVSFQLQDDDGNIYVFTLPEIKYDSGSTEIPGTEDDIFASLDFTAFRARSGSVDNQTFRIDRFPA